jgi:hypothetical protein
VRTPIDQVPFHLESSRPHPAIFGMKQLPGASSDESRAARAGRFAIGTNRHPLNMDVEELRTALAVAQLVFRIHVIAASRTDERARPLWMIGIEPVTAYPALEYLDVTITVIDHITKTTFVAYHFIFPLKPGCTGVRSIMLYSLMSIP